MRVLPVIGLGKSQFLAPEEVRIGPHLLRPFSFGSLVLSDALGLAWPEKPSADDCQRIAGRWIWAHGTPLARVKWAIYTGEWQTQVERLDFAPDLPRWAEEVMSYCAATLAAADSLWIECRPRPIPGGGKGESAPVDLVAPNDHASMVSEVMSVLPGADLEQVIWRTPLPTFLELYHVARWRDTRVWTVGLAKSSPQEVNEVRDQFRTLRDHATAKAAERTSLAMDRLAKMTERLTGEKGL